MLAWIDSKMRPFLVRLKIKGRKLPEPKEQLLERLFVVLVAFGVTVEFLALPISIFELIGLERTNLALTITVEELKKANLSMEKVVAELKAKAAPRRLTSSQEESIAKSLSKEFGAVAVVSRVADSESSDFADDFSNAFTNGNWYSARIRNRISIGHGVSVGTFEGTETEKPLSDVRTICNAFRLAGVPFESRMFKESEKASISPYFHTNVVYVVVDSKPP